MKTQLIVLAIVLGAVFILLALFLFAFSIPSDREVINTATTTPQATTDGSLANTTTVKIALLDTEGTTTGKERGCDRVVLVDREVPQTSMPLSAALKELFTLNDQRVDGLYHFIANTNETLSFDKATVEDGTATVYLKGSLSGLAGVCDDPRATIQIEETALQFPTVKTVVIYLNGEKTDLQPSQR